MYTAIDPPPGRPSGAAGSILSGGVRAAAPTRIQSPTQNSEEPVFTIHNKIERIKPPLDHVVESILKVVRPGRDLNPGQKLRRLLGCPLPYRDLQAHKSTIREDP
jgi:hypothetical protein